VGVETSEHDDPLGGAVERVAGGEDEALIAHAALHPQRGGRHYPGSLDAVGEARIGHGHDDWVARAQLVDRPKRRQEGGAVPGYRNRAALAGERRVRVVPRPLAQGRRVVAFDERVATVERGQFHPTDRVARARAVGVLGGKEIDSPL